VGIQPRRNQEAETPLGELAATLIISCRSAAPRFCELSRVRRNSAHLANRFVTAGLRSNPSPAPAPNVLNLALLGAYNFLKLAGARFLPWPLLVRLSRSITGVFFPSLIANRGSTNSVARKSQSHLLAPAGVAHLQTQTVLGDDVRVVRQTLQLIASDDAY